MSSSPLSRLLVVALLLVAGAGRSSAAGPSAGRAGTAARLGASEGSGTTTEATVLLAAVGDVLMHSGIKRAAADQIQRKSGKAPHLGFDWVMEGLRSKVSGADLAFCNVEFPVIPKDATDPYLFRKAGPYDFRAPPEALTALRWAGFDVGSLANNHVWNAGRPGLATTLEHMEKAGLLSVGAGRGCREAEEGIVVPCKGLRIAFLAAVESRIGADLNRGTDGLWVNRIDSTAGNLGRWALRIARARKRADVVVFSVHWGPREYVREPHETVRALGRMLCEAGVDLVLGHHPHVLQPVETHRAADGRSCLIAWSLGNALSNQSPDFVGTSRDREFATRRYGTAGLPARQKAEYGDRRDGVVLYVELAARPPVLRSWGWLPLWTWNNFYEYVNELSPRRVRCVGMDEEIARLRDRLRLLEERRARVAKLLGRGGLSEAPRRAGRGWTLPNRMATESGPSGKDG